MTENLKTTKYSDGSPIPLLTGNSAWINTNDGAYCWYVHSELNNGAEYGALYNGHAVRDNRGLCPVGWRVPCFYDWNSLILYVRDYYQVPNIHSNTNSVGNLFKSCRQIGSPFGVSCNTAAHPRWNSSSYSSPDPFGLSVLPAGQRSEGDFMGIGQYTCFWTSLPFLNNNRYYITFNTSTYAATQVAVNRSGFSVRCVRDINEPLE